MSNEVTVAPVSIMVSGANKLERQTSVVSRASSTALTACLTMKGKVGNAIRNAGARSGMVDVAMHAASGNYRPLAEYLAIQLGEPIVISSRSTFESLPDFFEARIAQAKLGKNDGMREDKKTGVYVPGAKLALAMNLKATIVDVIDQAREIHAARKAEREALAA